MPTSTVFINGQAPVPVESAHRVVDERCGMLFNVKLRSFGVRGLRMSTVNLDNRQLYVIYVKNVSIEERLCRLGGEKCSMLITAPLYFRYNVHFDDGHL